MILAAERPEPLLLEGTGRVIWDLLEEPLGRAELMVMLAEAFERDAAEVDLETTPFLAELRAAGALAVT